MVTFARCWALGLGLWGLLALGSAPATAAPADDIAAGISWLHSFEYERALAAFERAEKADARAPLAYWGQAMCYEQLLWGNENVEEARRILTRAKTNGALDRARAQERAWLASLEPLFGEGDRPARLAGFAAAMEKLAADYPDDPDAASFHGLALLATRSRGLAGAHHGGEQEQPALSGSAEQERAAQIFSRVLTRRPRHAGALHYLIHTWDDPANARKALEAARVYPSVAPESSHARHMPAHVFVQLGMWREAIASDQAAVRAAELKVQQDNLPVTAQDFHPLSWLVYEYMQANRFDDARRALEPLRTASEATRDPRLLSLAATLRTRIAIESQRWNALTGPGYVNYDELFGVGYSAAQRQDYGLAERARVRLSEMAKMPRYADRRVVIEIMALQVGAALNVVRTPGADINHALALLADATKAERSLPPSIGPPVLIKPAQEQYAETLLAAGRVEEAIAQFDAALERAPKRRLLLEGRDNAIRNGQPATTKALPIGGALITVILALVAVRRRRAKAA
jgi:tetratricopeptide (TPR) repeat protein